MKNFKTVFLCLMGVLISQPGYSVVDPFSRDELMKELVGNQAKTDDLTVYSDIVANYQANNPLKLKVKLQKLLSQYPQSQYVDNALYLAGRMSMENQNYPEAIRFFQKVITQHPHGNKVVSAQFAKAMTYKKMNLNSQAKKVLSELQKNFPGSPESFRADNELKLIK